MKILKKILLALVILVALIVVIGLVISGEFRVERSTTINASPASIYEEVANLKKNGKWSPWDLKDPNITYVFSGPDIGVGARKEWSSEHEEVGTGSQEVIEAVPNQMVRTELYFGGFDEPGYAEFNLEEDGDNTKVTWSMEGNMGSNPIFKIMGLFMGSMVGADYEEGLANLKARVESKPAFTIDISVTNEEPISYLAIRETFDVSKPETIGPRMGEIYGELMSYIESNGVKGMGQPMSVYKSLNENGWDAEIAIPVAEIGEVSADNIVASQTAGGKMLRGIHMGDYHKLDDTHRQLQAYMQFNELEANGDGYEIYVSDPTESDTAQWRTDVFYPIK